MLRLSWLCGHISGRVAMVAMGNGKVYTCNAKLRAITSYYPVSVRLLKSYVVIDIFDALKDNYQMKYGKVRIYQIGRENRNW